MPESKKAIKATQAALPVKDLSVLYYGNDNPSERYSRGVRRGSLPQESSSSVPPVMVLDGRPVAFGRPSQPKS
jgi:hypothetical protein